MASRLELHTLLGELLGKPSQVYFQPPASKVMVYPAIVYERDNIESTFADNKPYRHVKRYQITVIDRDPDSVIPDKISQLPLSRFVRHFASDSLNHDIFNLYF